MSPVRTQKFGEICMTFEGNIGFQSFTDIIKLGGF